MHLMTHLRNVPADTLWVFHHVHIIASLLTGCSKLGTKYGRDTKVAEMQDSS